MEIWFEREIGPFYAVAKVCVVEDSLGVPHSDFTDVRVEIIKLERLDEQTVTTGDMDRARDLIADHIWARLD